MVLLLLGIAAPIDCASADTMNAGNFAENSVGVLDSAHALQNDVQAAVAAAEKQHCIDPAARDALQKRANSLISSIDLLTSVFVSDTNEYIAEGVLKLERELKAMRRELLKIKPTLDKLPACVEPNPRARFGPRYSLASAAVPQFHIGLFAGGAAVGGIDTVSSSGFYGGSSTTTVGYMVGGSFFADVGTIGQDPKPFGTYTFGLGVVIDYSGIDQTWHGLGGGFPVDGKGRLGELNIIPELRVSTPITSVDTLFGYVGAGAAILMPHGMPTGFGGPGFLGTDATAAIRVGWGVDRKVTDQFSIGAKFGYQHAFSTAYDTTLAGERFLLKGKDEGLFGLTATYSFNAP